MIPPRETPKAVNWKEWSLTHFSFSLFSTLRWIQESNKATFSHCCFSSFLIRRWRIVPCYLDPYNIVLGMNRMEALSNKGSKSYRKLKRVSVQTCQRWFWVFAFDVVDYPGDVLVVGGTVSPRGFQYMTSQPSIYKYHASGVFVFFGNVDEALDVLWLRVSSKARHEEDRWMLWVCASRYDH